MSATESLCQIVGVKPRKFSKQENVLLEAILFHHICTVLKQSFETSITKPEESKMEDNLARCVIQDILSTEEYTLLGIACYTDTPEDVLCEVVTGNNTRPSAILLRKLIELHRFVRRDLYHEMVKKFATEFFSEGRGEVALSAHA
jgi:hypothetical protein